MLFFCTNLKLLTEENPVCILKGDQYRETQIIKYSSLQCILISMLDQYELPVYNYASL